MSSIHELHLDYVLHINSRKKVVLGKNNKNRTIFLLTMEALRCTYNSATVCSMDVSSVTERNGAFLLRSLAIETLFRGMPLKCVMRRLWQHLFRCQLVM